MKGVKYNFLGRTNMELGIILAGGKGVRMGTSKAKGSIPLVDKPMIEYVYDNLSQVVSSTLCYLYI